MLNCSPEAFSELAKAIYELIEQMKLLDSGNEYMGLKLIENN